MKISVACDHGGFNLKNTVVEYLKENGYEYVDYGTNSTDSCDYPDFALLAAEAVSSGECDRGILICSTGVGVSIVANKVKGVRCAHCNDVNCAELTRLHNDANVIAMGGKFVSAGDALKIVNAFLTTDFEGGRHQRRVDKITAVEKKYFK